jgi:hypothetical protein
VLVSPPRLDASRKTNAGLLAEYFDRNRIFRLPWLGGGWEGNWALKNLPVRRAVEKLASTF